MKLTVLQIYKLSFIALLFMAGLVLTAVVFPLANWLLTKNPAKKFCDTAKKQWLIWVAAVIGLNVEQHGEWPERTALIVSNHISWLDIVILGRCFPPYFVAKRDILDWPVISFLARQIGTIFIRRGDKKNILETSERMVWLLKQNTHVIFFPEGTTTAGTDVLNFHASLFQPAMLTKSLVQPVAIEYLGAAKAIAPFVGDDPFIPHLIKVLSLDTVKVRLTFLPPVNTCGKSRQTVCNESRTAVLAAIRPITCAATAQSIGQ